MRIFARLRTASFVVLLGLGIQSVAIARPSEFIEGNVRVQLLNSDLVRLEQKGLRGFEDRVTFNVVDRSGKSVVATRLEKNGQCLIKTSSFTVSIPLNAGSLRGATVISSTGVLLYEYQDLPKPTYLPAPSQKFTAWVMADSPRLVPPAWGAAPAPEINNLLETSGWDLDNDAPDVYVFINNGGGYKALRKDFLKLTGPTPMPPRYVFGFIDSRYYPYFQQEALDTIDEYRRRRFPLDVFVCDTDWRKNGSHGYEVSREHFPDMAQFIKDAHAKNVRLMYNDHPEPVFPKATDPKELKYRAEGLTSLLKLGIDMWWYDRNWGTHIASPAKGLPLEVWGMRVYTDITQQFAPTLRPAVMSNVWGVDNGYRNGRAYPAAHRYPIWWTGDTQSTWDFLQKGIENGVDLGVLSLLPYVNEDLGGHTGNPNAELYTRFLQFGCFSPVTRIHCTMGRDRHPWIYGSDTENTVREYIRLRYRLLPTIYTAARRAYDDGTPLMRRCDLEWPDQAGANDPTQYLFGDDLLIAPVYEGLEGKVSTIPSSMLKTDDGQPGLTGAYYNNADISGQPVLSRVDSQVAFDWDDAPVEGLQKDSFSVRWTGQIGPVPETGEYAIQVRADDGVRLWVNGEKLIGAWVPQDDVTQKASIRLEKGQSYPIRLEYFQKSGNAICQLGWRIPSQVEMVMKRTLWIPPGQWSDLWTGTTYTGPTQVTVESPTWHLPMFARMGGLVLLAPNADFSDQKPWDAMTIEAFVPTQNGKVRRELYEDDCKTNDYKSKTNRRTPVEMVRSGQTVTLNVLPASGWFKDALTSRSWTVRFHLPNGAKVETVRVNGDRVASIVRTLEPQAGTGIGRIPLQGVGSLPPAGSGATVEVSLPRGEVDQPTKIEITLNR
jgi:alpha-glucosidase (family GH31 glycosyl hydrolase)